MLCKLYILIGLRSRPDQDRTTKRFDGFGRFRDRGRIAAALLSSYRRGLYSAEKSSIQYSEVYNEKGGQNRGSAVSRTTALRERTICVLSIQSISDIVRTTIDEDPRSPKQSHDTPFYEYCMAQDFVYNQTKIYDQRRQHILDTVLRVCTTTAASLPPVRSLERLAQAKLSEWLRIFVCDLLHSLPRLPCLHL